MEDLAVFTALNHSGSFGTEKPLASSKYLNEVVLNCKSFLVKEQVLRTSFKEYVLKDKLGFKRQK